MKEKLDAQGGISVMLCRDATRPYGLGRAGSRRRRRPGWRLDRKSTRLNSSHLVISYAVFCLKKKKNLIADCPFVIAFVHSASRVHITDFVGRGPVGEFAIACAELSPEEWVGVLNSALLAAAG